MSAYTAAASTSIPAPATTIFRTSGTVAIGIASEKLRQHLITLVSSKDISVVGDAAVEYYSWRHDAYNFGDSVRVTLQIKCVDQVSGFMFNLSYPTMPVPFLPRDFAEAGVAKVSMIVGQVPFWMSKSQLYDVLTQVTGASILGLRQQFRRGTNRTQVTGMWFVDVDPKDFDAMEKANGRVLLRQGGATVHATADTMQQWLMDRAEMLQKFELTPQRRVLGAMTVELQRTQQSE